MDTLDLLRLSFFPFPSSPTTIRWRHASLFFSCAHAVINPDERFVGYVRLFLTEFVPAFLHNLNDPEAKMPIDWKRDHEFYQRLEGTLCLYNRRRKLSEAARQDLKQVLVILGEMKNLCDKKAKDSPADATQVLLIHNKPNADLKVAETCGLILSTYFDAINVIQQYSVESKVEEMLQQTSPVEQKISKKLELLESYETSWVGTEKAKNIPDKYYNGEAFTEAYKTEVAALKSEEENYRNRAISLKMRAKSLAKHAKRFEDFQKELEAIVRAPRATPGYSLLESWKETMHYKNQIDCQRILREIV